MSTDYNRAASALRELAQRCDSDPEVTRRINAALSESDVAYASDHMRAFAILDEYTRARRVARLAS